MIPKDVRLEDAEFSWGNVRAKGVLSLPKLSQKPNDPRGKAAGLVRRGASCYDSRPG